MKIFEEICNVWINQMAKLTHCSRKHWCVSSCCCLPWAIWLVNAPAIWLECHSQTISDTLMMICNLRTVDICEGNGNKLQIIVSMDWMNSLGILSRLYHVVLILLIEIKSVRNFDFVLHEITRFSREAKSLRFRLRVRQFLTHSFDFDFKDKMFAIQLRLRFLF